MEQRLAADDLAGWRLDQTHDAQTRHGFTGAGLTNDAERAPFMHRKTDVIYCFNRVLIRSEFGDQIADFEEWRRRLHRLKDTALKRHQVQLPKMLNPRRFERGNVVVGMMISFKTYANGRGAQHTLVLTL